MQYSIVGTDASDGSFSIADCGLNSTSMIILYPFLCAHVGIL